MQTDDASIYTDLKTDIYAKRGPMQMTRNMNEKRIIRAKIEGNK